MTGLRFLFVSEAGPQSGGGPVMRALTLAGALAGQGGAACVFLSAPPVNAILDAFAPGSVRLAAASTEPRDLTAAATAEPFPFDAVVFDHPGLGARDHRAIAQGRPSLVIDNLADREVEADLVADSGLARSPEDYEGLIPAETRLLLGPAYAPIRPEFAALRETALAWRGEPVQRILVSMGMADAGGITARIVERLRLRVGEVGVDVVLGAGAPSLPGLLKVARRDTRLTVHVDTPHMARLTAEADVAVGCAGSAAWERCVLGLPSLQIVLAEPERRDAEALAARGAALAADLRASDFEAQFDRGVTRLLIDAELRRSLAAASSELCDGEGAGRLAQALLQRVKQTA